MDLIDRKALRDSMTRQVRLGGGAGRPTFDQGTVFDVIDRAPTVTPEPPAWEPTHTFKGNYGGAGTYRVRVLLTDADGSEMDTQYDTLTCRDYTLTPIPPQPDTVTLVVRRDTAEAIVADTGLTNAQNFDVCKAARAALVATEEGT